MAITRKVVRLVGNPRKRRKARKVNPRRKSLEQKLYFGSKAQRAAAAKALSSKRKRKRKAKTSHRRRVTKNPALLLTLGAVNPRRRKTVARRRKKVNSHRRRRRPNATKIVVMAPKRRRYTRRRKSAVNPRRRSSYRRRNPSAFGQTGKNMAVAVAGGLVGVTAAKMIPTFLPPSMKFGGNLMPTVITGVSAVVAGMIAKKVVPNGPFGDGVLFGGLMQTASQALNTWVPSIGSRFSLGALVPGSYPVPQNPITAGIPAPVRVTTSGLHRAFGTAF